MSSNNTMLNFESQLNEKTIFPEKKYNWSLMWANNIRSCFQILYQITYIKNFNEKSVWTSTNGKMFPRKTLKFKHNGSYLQFQDSESIVLGYTVNYRLV